MQLVKQYHDDPCVVRYNLHEIITTNNHMNNSNVINNSCGKHHDVIMLGDCGITSVMLGTLPENAISLP